MAEFGLPEEMSFNPYDLIEMKQKMRKILQNKIDVSSIKDIVLRKYSWKNSAGVLYNNIIGVKVRQIRRWWGVKLCKLVDYLDCCTTKYQQAA